MAMSKKTILARIKDFKTHAVKARLAGNITVAMQWEDWVDRLVAEAEKRGFGDDAFLVENSVPFRR
jgi:hypothetical protein